MNRSVAFGVEGDRGYASERVTQAIGERTVSRYATAATAVCRCRCPPGARAVERMLQMSSHRLGDGGRGLVGCLPAERLCAGDRGGTRWAGVAVIA